MVKTTVHIKNKTKTKKTVEEHNKILTDITKVETVGTIPILREIKETPKVIKNPVKKEEVNTEKREMTKTVKVTDKANRTETKKDKKDKELKAVKKTKATKTVKAKTAEGHQTKNLIDTNHSDLTVNLYRRVDKEVKADKEVKEVKGVKADKADKEVKEDLLIGTTFLMKKRRI